MINTIYNKIIPRIRKTLGLSEIPKYKIDNFLRSQKVSTNHPNNNKISIVIPCYKHGVYLKKCLESILKQTKKPDEIIFVNDFSDDDTLNIIEKFYKENNNIYKITIINNKKNLGQAASINLGVTQSHSSYIMILNDDDYLCDKAVETIMYLFLKHKELSMIGSTCIQFSKNEELSGSQKIIPFTEDNLESVKLTIHTPSLVKHYKNYNDLNMTHSGMTFTKEAWKTVGGYISNKKDRLVKFSDRDFQLRIALLFPVGVSLKTPFSFWRTNSSVDSGLNS